MSLLARRRKFYTLVSAICNERVYQLVNNSLSQCDKKFAMKGTVIDAGKRMRVRTICGSLIFPYRK